MGVFLKWLYVLVSQLLLGYNKEKTNATSLVIFSLEKQRTQRFTIVLLREVVYVLKAYILLLSNCRYTSVV